MLSNVRGARRPAARAARRMMSAGSRSGRVARICPRLHEGGAQFVEHRADALPAVAAARLALGAGSLAASEDITEAVPRGHLGDLAHPRKVLPPLASRHAEHGSRACGRANPRRPHTRRHGQSPRTSKVPLTMNGPISAAAARKTKPSASGANPSSTPNPPERRRRCRAPATLITTCPAAGVGAPARGTTAPAPTRRGAGRSHPRGRIAPGTGRARHREPAAVRHDAVRRARIGDRCGDLQIPPGKRVLGRRWRPARRRPAPGPHHRSPRSTQPERRASGCGRDGFPRPGGLLEGRWPIARRRPAPGNDGVLRDAREPTISSGRRPPMRPRRGPPRRPGSRTARPAGRREPPPARAPAWGRPAPSRAPRRRPPTPSTTAHRAPGRGLPSRSRRWCSRCRPTRVHPRGPRSGRLPAGPTASGRSTRRRSPRARPQGCARCRRRRPRGRHRRTPRTRPAPRTAPRVRGPDRRRRATTRRHRSATTPAATGCWGDEPPQTTHEAPAAIGPGASAMARRREPVIVAPSPAATEL